MCKLNTETSISIVTDYIWGKDVFQRTCSAYFRDAQQKRRAQDMFKPIYQHLKQGIIYSKYILEGLIIHHIFPAKHY